MYSDKAKDREEREREKDYLQHTQPQHHRSLSHSIEKRDNENFSRHRIIFNLDPQNKSLSIIPNKNIIKRRNKIKK